MGFLNNAALAGLGSGLQAGGGYFQQQADLQHKHDVEQAYLDLAQRQETAREAEAAELAKERATRTAQIEEETKKAKQQQAETVLRVLSGRARTGDTTDLLQSQKDALDAGGLGEGIGYRITQQPLAPSGNLPSGGAIGFGVPVGAPPVANSMVDSPSNEAALPAKAQVIMTPTDQAAVAQQAHNTAYVQSLRNNGDARSTALADFLESHPEADPEKAATLIDKLNPKSEQTKNPVKVAYRDPKTGKNVERWVSADEAMALGPMESPMPASVIVNTGKTEKTNKLVQTLGDSILSGKALLDPEGLSRQGVYADVAGYVLEHGGDLNKLRLDAIAAKENVKHANDSQQLRIRQDIDVIDHSLDKVDALADRWNAPMWGPFSRVSLAQAQQGTFGADAKKVATQLAAQVEEVKARLASVYQNGGAPTQEAQKRADAQLAAWMDAGTLHEMTKLARYNTSLQKSAMDTTGAVVPGSQPKKSKFTVTIQ